MEELVHEFSMFIDTELNIDTVSLDICRFYFVTILIHWVEP
jgi:hypothetical protein